MAKSETSKILFFISAHPECSSSDIHAHLQNEISLATAKRQLAQLVTTGEVVSIGTGRSTRYIVSIRHQLLHSIDPALYFKQEIDERTIRASFNFELSETLKGIHLFSAEELNRLNNLHAAFKARTAAMDVMIKGREMERLAIDLSWKSSQIEGNTYSLLETEVLLKEKKTASGRTKDEATMLLNHKEAIDLIVENPTFILPLSLAMIENIHSILIKELNVSQSIRRRRVGISGTNYRPLENEFQIREAMEQMCGLINDRENVFEKALLALALISYIQPFEDGNKRTARILSNALLLGEGYCPLSFRTVDPIDYKMAMLIFYEQNNLSAVKGMFIDQYEFAVNTYF
jgi:Fic family protein